MKKPPFDPADPRIVAVKEHAVEKENYENGWDVVVETMEDAEIYALVKRTYTAKGAIKKVAAHVGVREDYRKELVAAGGGRDDSVFRNGGQTEGEW